MTSVENPQSTVAFSPLISARLVYDGGDTVYIPPQMGTPRADQMQGTAAEQLAELAGRICYDSLGKGRPSFGCERNGQPVEGYHEHIEKTGHGSVLEHFQYTVEMPLHDSIGPEGAARLFHALVGRPGVTIRTCRAVWNHPQDREALDWVPGICVTTNLRVVRDWSSMTSSLGLGGIGSYFWEYALKSAASRIAPSINRIWGCRSSANSRSLDKIAASQINIEPVLRSRLVKPETDNEKWVTLFLSGSRGMSHEQVRHGDFTAISQRSTRYVDESESDWVEHPLVTQCLSEYRGPVPEINPIGAIKGRASEAYQATACMLQQYLTARSADATTARKQARGAARGLLGNALYTEMLFSASVAQWKRMLRQRLSDAADAEIRVMYSHVLRELKASRYGNCFGDDEFSTRPAKDGVGVVLG